VAKTLISLDAILGRAPLGGSEALRPDCARYAVSPNLHHKRDETIRVINLQLRPDALVGALFPLASKQGRGDIMRRLSPRRIRLFSNTRRPRRPLSLNSVGSRKEVNCPALLLSLF
jgi:hypothetical protein